MAQIRNDQKRIAAIARMRFGVFTPWKICTKITQGAALASEGKACLDPGTFIFTNLYGNRRSKFRGFQGILADGAVPCLNSKPAAFASPLNPRKSQAAEQRPLL
jgi:hypothetical protein